MLLVRGDFKDACEKVYTTLMGLYCGTSLRWQQVCVALTTKSRKVGGVMAVLAADQSNHIRENSRDND